MSADIFRQIADTGLTFFSLQTGQPTNEHLHQSALNSAGCDTKQFPAILHDVRAFIIKYHIACALCKTWRQSYVTQSAAGVHKYIYNSVKSQSLRAISSGDPVMIGKQTTQRSTQQCTLNSIFGARTDATKSTDFEQRCTEHSS